MKRNKNNLRVLHICQRDNPDTGGSLRVAEALVREQRQVGLDAWLLFLYGPPGHVTAMLGTQIICLGLESSRQAMKGIVQLVGEIRRLKPDIIHSHDGINWPRLAFMQLRIPVVTHSHLPINLTLNWASRTLIRFTTDVVVGISLHTINTWIEAGYPASKIHYVPNGVDFKRFEAVSPDQKQNLRDQLDLPADKRIIVWMGRLHQQMKGTDRVERLAPIVPEDTVIVVVGNGPSYDGMLERCREDIAAGRIIMVGTTSVPDLYFKAADWFLFTSYQEAFGLVILEAVASELPVIAYPVTGGGGAVQLLHEFNPVQLDDTMSDDELHDALTHLRDPGIHVADNLEKARNAYSLDQVSYKVVEVYKLAINNQI